MRKKLGSVSGIEIFELKCIEIADFVFYSLGLIFQKLRIFDDGVVIDIDLDRKKHKENIEKNQSSFDKNAIVFEDLISRAIHQKALIKKINFVYSYIEFLR